MLLLLAPGTLDASRLPIKTYTTADGLARDYVTCIEQDSRGFLWFCTAEGLSRFDGYQFANYHVEQGLPATSSSDFLQTRRACTGARPPAGSLGSIRRARVRPLPALPLATPAAATCPPSSMRTARAGSGAEPPPASSRLFHLGPNDSAFARSRCRRRTRGSTTPPARRSWSTAAGRSGSGRRRGLPARSRSGAERSRRRRAGLGDTFVMQLLEDQEGRIWVGTAAGWCAWKGWRTPRHPPVARLRAQGRPPERADRIASRIFGWNAVGGNQRGPRRVGSRQRRRTGASSAATRSRRGSRAGRRRAGAGPGRQPLDRDLRVRRHEGRAERFHRPTPRPTASFRRSRW